MTGRFTLCNPNSNTGLKKRVNKTKTEEILALPGGRKMRSGAMSLTSSPKATSYLPRQQAPPPLPGGHLICTPPAPPLRILTQPTVPFFLKCFSLFKFVDHASLASPRSQATPFWCLSLDPPSHPQSLSLELPTALPLASPFYLHSLTWL